MEIKDLSYSIALSGQSKRLLKVVNFHMKDGDLCAVIGPSGAGKSTLLDLISNRKLDGRWSGNILIDGKERSTSFAKDTAYVLQDDAHFDTLTVEETLKYAAWTRLDISEELKARRIEEIMKAMGLDHIRSSMAGKISGGEKKRLSIAVEVLALPRLILLDEPTSGLDSRITLELMTIVRAFTVDRRITVCTIHQPSRHVLALFDKVLLLACGRVIFFGSPVDAVVHFTSAAVGYTFQGAYRNPAEFLLDISGGHILSAGCTQAKQPVELEQLYICSAYHTPTGLKSKSSSAGSNQSSEASSAAAASGASGGSGDGPPQQLYAVSTYSQLQMLLHRTWTAQFRNVAELHTQLLTTFLNAVLLGCMYFGEGNVDAPFYENGRIASDTLACVAVLYEAMLIAMYLNLSAIPYLASNTYLYRRELAANAYSTAPYWLAHTLTPLPWQIVLHVVFTMVYFYMCQLPTGAGYFFYYFTATFMGSYLSLITAMALAANTSTVFMALALYPVLLTALVAFGGYAIKLHNLPVWWHWASYLSFPRWLFEALMINHFERYDTDDYSGMAENGNGDILGDYGFYDLNKGAPLGILLLFFAATLAVLYYGLLPPVSQLVKVPLGFEVASHPGKTELIYKDNNKLLKKRSQQFRVKFAADNKLDENLLGGAIVSDSSNDKDSDNSPILEDPVIEYSPPLRTESYKISSGAMAMAQGCKLTFHDVRYTVQPETGFFGSLSLSLSLQTTQVKAPEKLILKGVSGTVLPGEMCAIMGASGAGKSSLLNILGQRKIQGIRSGDVLYDNRLSTDSFAYVIQEDIHMSVLTVRECVQFAAELRLPTYLTDVEKTARVNKILGVVSLQDVQHSVVGSVVNRGISGGQLRRLSIAVEIIHLPDLLLLDEPTTGLDSSTALQVVCALRNLANQNRTVVCTLHQPSDEIFEHLDKVLLLGEGRVIYFGAARKAAEYFTSSPYAFPLPHDANPADFIVAVAGGSVAAADGRHVTPAELAVLHSTSQNVELERSRPSSPSLHSASTTEPPEQTTAAFRYKLMVLLKRRVLVLQREWRLTAFAATREVLTGLFYGSVWFQLGHGTAEHLYTDRLSLFYYTALLCVYGIHLERISWLVDDRAHYYRERGVHTYGTFSYYVSVWLPMLPVYAFTTFIYCAVMYPLSGLRAGGDIFFVFYYFVLFSGFAGMFQIYAITSLCSSTSIAVTVIPVFLLAQIVPAGFFMYIPQLVPWMRAWVPYVTFVRYAVQGLTLNEMHDNGNLPESGYYLNEFGYNTISTGGCAALLFLFTGVYAALLYFALRFVDFE